MKVSVRSIPPSFRRAGMAFTEKEQTVEVDEKKLAILEAEKMLMVRRIGEEEGEDLNKLTNAQLTEEILKIDKDAKVNGLKKDALVEMLQGLQAAK